MYIDYKKIRESSLEKLIEIRDDPSTPQSVVIQAIQSINKLIADSPEASAASSSAPTEQDIMEKIRSSKK